MSMATENNSTLGRQAHLPLSRAFQISLNSLKIRFWRSMVTAGGIFLGIAFFATVRTQSMMQWPIPTKIDAGYVRVDGQVNGPGDYEVWSPVNVKEGIDAGIPSEVIDRIAKDSNTFSLTNVVQGKLQYKRAIKNRARVNKEWVGLKKFSPKLQFFVDVAGDKDMPVGDALKYGIPKKIVHALAGKDKTFKGSALADYLRESPKWIEPIYLATALDQDISIKDGIRAGVPEAIVLHLTGEGKVFKGSALNDAVNAHPTWMKIWKARVKRYTIFNTVDDAAIKRVGKSHTLALNDILKQAKNPDPKTADMSNIMVVNMNGRKLAENFIKDNKTAGNIKMVDGDYILIPDRNIYYRTYWLLVMSLLVCAVGIMNSMLMSVTERFKEIGTMKCLGALDSFVVLLFMLESGMMGIAASVLGWTLGTVIMIVIAGFTKGWGMVATIGFLNLLGSFLVSVGVGLGLTILATIIPAKRAADMPAAMALRSEV